MAKICPNCGKQNKITAKFCEDCGTALNDVTKASRHENTQKREQQTKIQQINQIKSWWDARDTKDKAVTWLAACCLSVIIFAAICGALAPDKNLTDLHLFNATSDGAGEYHLDIDNATTDLIINGSTEAGAIVTVTSSELNLTNQKVELDSNNSFHYKVEIPANVNEVKVKFSTDKQDKDGSYIELTIKRPSAQVTVPAATDTPPNTVKAADYPICPLCGAVCNKDLLSGIKASKNVGMCPNCDIVVDAPQNLPNSSVVCAKCKSGNLQTFNKWGEPTKYKCMNYSNIGWLDDIEK